MHSNRNRVPGYQVVSRAAASPSIALQPRFALRSVQVGRGRGTGMGNVLPLPSVLEQIRLSAILLLRQSTHTYIYRERERLGFLALT